MLKNILRWSKGDVGFKDGARVRLLGIDPMLRAVLVGCEQVLA